jgi:Reverse transcriptase (RNA-dependent DNA polymerase)
MTSKWLSKEAVAAKRNRRHLERRWLSSGKENDRQIYRRACRSANRIIQDSRSNFTREKLSETRDDPRKRWNVVKDLLHSAPGDNSQTSEENLELCRSFSNHFISKIQTLKATISDQLSRISPSLSFPDSATAGPVLYSLPPVTPSEVLKMLSFKTLKSSSVDVLPASLLHSCKHVFSDLISHLANLSFTQGRFPASFKSAFVTPLLKNPGLDKSLPSSYRPISNLNTISKLIERLFLNRIQSFVTNSPNFNQFQSAYRPRHSTETALLSTLDSVFHSSDSGNSTLVVSLDLSAAFDSIEHSILLERLKTSFGFAGMVYSWTESYLTGRSQTVKIGSSFSKPLNLTSGVPQGSVLGPLLFSIYTSPVASIASFFSVSQQQYADDSQLFISLSHGHSQDISRLENCLTALHAWFCQNSLSLNPDKSDTIILGTRQRAHSYSDLTSVNIAGTVVPLADHIKVLGVTLDSHLTMDKHVSAVSRACFYHLRALRHIRSSLNIEDAKMIACSIVGSRLDYANSVLYGVSRKNINLLQRVQNALARCVFDSKERRTRSLDLLRQLHWLPVEYRVKYKVAKFAFLARSSASTAYLNSSVSIYQPQRSLRSDNSNLLTVPRSTHVIGSRAFRIAAPTVFNALPSDLRLSTNLQTFCSKLKTFYFDSAFNTP